MTKKNQTTEELSYYRLTLIDYLRSSFPERLNDEEFINKRDEEASEAYEEAIRDGMTQEEASTEANAVLFEGLYFSKFDTIMDVLTEEFTEELEEDQFRPFAMQMMPVCEKVFSRYELTDDFAYSPEYDKLYTEITGAIQIWIEENGVQVQAERI